MHVVINRLPIRPDADWSALCDKIDELDGIAATHSGAFRGISLARTDDGEGLVLVYFTDRAELDRVSREVAGPWFAQNIRPYLAGAVSRSVGEVLAGRLAGGT
jgi:hypothetical protein